MTQFARVGQLCSQHTRGIALKSLMVLAAAAGAAMTLSSTGVADAQGSPSVAGQKFSEASATLKKAGYDVKVAAAVGDRLSQDDCVVTNQREFKPAGFGPSQFKVQKTMVMLTIDCNSAVASVTDAGSSAESPEGRAAKEVQKKVEWEKSPEGQAWCEQTKHLHPTWNFEGGDPKLAGCKSAG